MKLEDLYSKAKQVMNEKPSSKVYDNSVVAVANLVLAELFQENNVARVFYGKEPFKNMPNLQSREDEVDYESEYLNEVIPLGMAAYFFIDDDLSKYAIFNTKYNNARVKNQKIVSEEDYDALSS